MLKLAVPNFFLGANRQIFVYGLLVIIYFLHIGTNFINPSVWSKLNSKVMSLIFCLHENVSNFARFHSRPH
jgi:hypothetical protein